MTLVTAAVSSIGITTTLLQRNRKKVTTSWPRDKPQAQIMFELWLKNARDPDTGKFYEKRDNNGNTIKGTSPKRLVRQIVRIKTNDGMEWLYPV